MDSNRGRSMAGCILYARIHWRCGNCSASEMNPYGKPYIKKCPHCGSRELEFSDNNFAPVDERDSLPLPELTGTLDEQIETLSELLNGPNHSVVYHLRLIQMIVEKRKQKDSEYYEVKTSNESNQNTGS